MIRCARCALALLLLLCNEWLEKKIWNALALSSGSSFSFPEKLKRSLRIEKNHLLIIFARFYLFRAAKRLLNNKSWRGYVYVLSLNPLVEAHHSKYISCQYIPMLPVFFWKPEKLVCLTWKKVLKNEYYMSSCRLTFISYYTIMNILNDGKKVYQRYLIPSPRCEWLIVYPKLFHPNPHHV